MEEKEPKKQKSLSHQELEDIANFIKLNIEKFHSSSNLDDDRRIYFIKDEKISEIFTKLGVNVEETYPIELELFIERDKNFELTKDANATLMQVRVTELMSKLGTAKTFEALQDITTAIMQERGTNNATARIKLEIKQTNKYKAGKPHQK